MALDAADAALHAAEGFLFGSDLGTLRRDLVAERQVVADDLARLAAALGVRPAPWLSPVPVRPPMLGLPVGTRACLFDLDDVLTDSSVLHALAWAEVFDDFLLRLAEQAGWQFVPFDREADYRQYLEGRPRLEGVHVFLASRGIHIPEGRPGGPRDADTAYGLARRKAAALQRDIGERGITAVGGARRYLEAVGHAGIARGVLSASASTDEMLDLAGLASLVDDRIDASVIEREELRSRPAPDTALSVCRRLGVPPAQTVCFTCDSAGIAAARGAGIESIAVGSLEESDDLLAFGAVRVVPSLTVLLDSRLVAR